jgi:hypothetical protein
LHALVLSPTAFPPHPPAHTWRQWRCWLPSSAHPSAPLLLLCWLLLLLLLQCLLLLLLQCLLLLLLLLLLQQLLL